MYYKEERKMPFINDDRFYRVDKITPNTWRIAEPIEPTVTMYLICGSERAVLVDTAFGLGDLAGLCAKLTDKPITLFCSHAHPDHVLGNWQFESALLGAEDNGIYAVLADEENYAKMMTSEESQWAREVIKKNTGITDFSEINATDIKFCPVENIKDGDVIDLGDRKLEVLAVPGHTPGSLVLVDRTEKAAYSGDAINQYPWMFLEESLSLEEYRDSLERALKKLEGIEKIYHGHAPEEPVYIDELPEQIRHLDDVIDGKLTGEFLEQPAGKCLKLDFDKWHLFYDPKKIHRQN